MLITPRGVIALQALRLELQEEAGEHFPQSMLQEMLVLYDVCYHLQLNIFQCRDILGESGWQYVTEYINAPIGSWLRIEHQSTVSHTSGM